MATLMPQQLRIRQLSSGLRHRMAYFSLITGATGRGSWVEATSESINRALADIAEQDRMTPELYHWIDFAQSGKEVEFLPLPVHAPVIDAPLRRLEALSDDELARRVARALALPPLRYATAFGDAHDMEEALPKTGRVAYAQALATVVDEGAWAWRLLHATPRERCIAALLALGEG
jgi:hypothetical protein